MALGTTRLTPSSTLRHTSSSPCASTVGGLRALKTPRTTRAPLSSGREEAEPVPYPARERAGNRGQLGDSRRFSAQHVLVEAAVAPGRGPLAEGWHWLTLESGIDGDAINERWDREMGAVLLGAGVQLARLLRHRRGGRGGGAEALAVHADM